MNIEKLRCFKTVAETKHLTHAAESLFMSQPALSKLMVSLESELNISLYEKEGRNIVLTEAGKVFYPHVVTALHELDKGIMAAQHEVAVKNNTVFLSAIISAYNNCLPSLLAEFRRQNLDCRFAVEYKYTTRILQELLDGKCDLGVCGDFPENADFAALERTLLWKNPCTLIVGKNHRFASMDKVRVEDLRNETFVIWNRSNLGTNKDLIDICKPHGFLPNFGAEAFNDMGVLSAVAMGEGIASLPLSQNLNVGAVVRVTLEDTNLSQRIFLAWRKGSSLPPAAKRFKRFLIDATKDNQFNCQ